MPKLTEEQKAARRERAEARRQAQRERWEQEQQDKERAAQAMREVLDSPDSSPAQKIFALEILDNLKYYRFIPYQGFTKMQTDEAADAKNAAFKKEFAAAHPEIMREIEAGTL